MIGYCPMREIGGQSNFDVQDLREHLDTTFRGWSSAARVRLVISRLVLIFALPLDFHGRVSCGQV